MRKKVISKKEIFYKGEFNASLIYIDEAEKLLHAITGEVEKKKKRKSLFSFLRKKKNNVDNH